MMASWVLIWSLWTPVHKACMASQAPAYKTFSFWMKSLSYKMTDCVVCEKQVTKRQHALQCDGCDLWQHRLCGTDINLATYRQLVKGQINFDFFLHKVSSCQKFSTNWRQFYPDWCTQFINYSFAKFVFWIIYR